MNVKARYNVIDNKIADCIEPITAARRKLKKNF